MTTINTKQMKAALAVVSKAVSAKSTLPILGNILIDAQPDGLLLAATNLELGIQVQVPYANLFDGSTAWKTTMPAQIFSQLVSISDAEQLTLGFTKDSETLSIKAGKSSASLKGIDAEEFPPFPATSTELGKIPAGKLRNALRRVVLAASKDMSRPALQTVQMKNDGGLRFTAADGFRLASCVLSGLAFEFPYEKGLLLAAAPTAKLVDVLPDGDDEVTVSVSESVAKFAWEGMAVWVSLAAESFPDWKAILPKSAKYEITLPTTDAVGAINRAEIFSREGSMAVTLVPSDNGLIVMGRDAASGKSETVIETAIPSGMPKVSFNAKFARDLVGAVGGPAVKLSINANNAPVLITRLDDDGYLAILMPLLTPDDYAAAKAQAQVEQEAAVVEA